MELKSKIRSDLKRAHLGNLNKQSYLSGMREDVVKIVERYTEQGFREYRALMQGLVRVTKQSKANNFSTQQYLKLLVNLIEGVVNDYHKELNEQKRIQNRG